MQSPCEHHFSAVKKISGTSRVPYIIVFISQVVVVRLTYKIPAYSDADWAGCPANRRGASGYCGLSWFEFFLLVFKERTHCVKIK